MSFEVSSTVPRTPTAKMNAPNAAACQRPETPQVWSNSVDWTDEADEPSNNGARSSVSLVLRPEFASCAEEDESR